MVATEANLREITGEQVDPATLPTCMRIQAYFT